jgi:hypothetical protein
LTNCAPHYSVCKGRGHLQSQAPARAWRGL